MFYYHLLDKNNKVVLSDLPKNYFKYFNKCTSKNEIIHLESKKCRHGKLSDSDGNIAYIITIDKNEVNSSKIFKSKLSLYLKFIQEIIEIKNEIVNKVLHDITKINGYCIQELYELVPENIFKTKTYKKQISQLEKHLLSKSRNIAKGLFKINRNVLHIKTECSKLKYLFSKKFTTYKKLHNINDAIKPSLHVYIPHFQKKNVNIVVDNKYSKKINLNFEYLEAALFPLLDNALKYIIHDSTLSIYFGETIDGYAINFDMISMTIYEDEKNDVFNDGISGKNALKNKLNGKGIGMGSITQSLLVNNAELRVNINVNKRREKRYKNTNYERNVFQIVFFK